MATVNRTPSALLAPRSESAVVAVRSAPPQLLRCLVVSLSAERRRLIRAAAEAQAWDAIVCRDAGEFLRVAFKRSVPLLAVDLPDRVDAGYVELKNATERVQQIAQSLLLVAGVGAESNEEIWARSLGAWAYLNEAASQRGFEFMFDEARRVIDKRTSMGLVELGAPGK